MAISIQSSADVMTAGELAERLGVTEQTVYALARRDKLPAILRLGRNVFFPRQRTMQALAEGWQPPKLPEEARSLTGKEKAEAMERAEAEREAERTKSRAKAK